MSLWHDIANLLSFPPRSLSPAHLLSERLHEMVDELQSCLVISSTQGTRVG